MFQISVLRVFTIESPGTINRYLGHTDAYRPLSDRCPRVPGIYGLDSFSIIKFLDYLIWTLLNGWTLYVRDLCMAGFSVLDSSDMSEFLDYHLDSI